MTREEYMQTLVPLAMLYVAAIHDEGPDTATEVLDAACAITPPAGIAPERAIMTVLAAMVSPTASRSEMLGWTDNPIPHIPRPQDSSEPLAVLLALAGLLEARQLTEEQNRAVVQELAVNRGWGRDAIAAHLNAGPADVRRWISTARQRHHRGRSA